LRNQVPQLTFENYAYVGSRLPVRVIGAIIVPPGGIYQDDFETICGVTIGLPKITHGAVNIANYITSRAPRLFRTCVRRTITSVRDVPFLFSPSILSFYFFFHRSLRTADARVSLF